MFKNHKKKNRSRKQGDKDGKAMYKLMSNVAYVKTMESLRNRPDVRLVSKKKSIWNGNQYQAICHKKCLAIF